MFQRLALVLVALFSLLGSIGCALSAADADVETVSVTGRLTHNGATPGVGPGCDGSPDADMVTLVFRERFSGAVLFRSMSCSALDFRFETDLPLGAWKVIASPYAGSRSSLPDGAFVVAEVLDVTGPVTDVTFDIETHAVSGRVTLDGVRPILGPDCSAEPIREALSLTFVDLASGTTGTSSVLCAASDFAFAAELSPGDYETTVTSYVDDRTNFPDGRFVASSALRVSAPTSEAMLDVKMLR